MLQIMVIVAKCFYVVERVRTASASTLDVGHVVGLRIASKARRPVGWVPAYLTDALVALPAQAAQFVQGLPDEADDAILGKALHG